jgi:hypothetical protein
LLFFIAGSSHCDDPNGLASLRPNDGDKPPIQFANAKPAFFCAPGRRDRMERPAVKQDFGVDKIESAGFQHGDPLGLGPLKIHPTNIYPRLWIQSSWVLQRPCGGTGTTLIVIDSDAEPGRVRVLVDRLMASDKPAELARLATQTRLMADYEEQKMATPPA